jgi:hypothetical protein
MPRTREAQDLNELKQAHLRRGFHIFPVTICRGDNGYRKGRHAKTPLISQTPSPSLSIIPAHVSRLLKGERMPEWVTQLFNGMIGGGAVAGLVTFLDFRLREKWKHDLQQKLEAYKVSLIAEAEAAKAKQDLKKSIALRYAEIEFERFVELEHIVAGLSPEVLAYAVITGICSDGK